VVTSKPAYSWDALLLDLDGTLLDLDGDAFLESYTEVVADAMTPVVERQVFLDTIMSAVIPVMVTPHPGERNRDVLWNGLAHALNTPREFLEARLEALLSGDLSRIHPGGAPRPGARELIYRARARGIKLAVATMPIYPLAVVKERLRRAGLAEFAWDLVATDGLHAVKPHPEYFLELCGLLGADPERCLMVGDDYFQDIAARSAGLATYYVGPPLRGIDPGWSGTLLELAETLDA
jgi:FMN phosphatase YigB (HAD superfamily)